MWVRVWFSGDASDGDPPNSLTGGANSLLVGEDPDHRIQRLPVPFAVSYVTFQMTAMLFSPGRDGEEFPVLLRCTHRHGKFLLR